ncbi:PLP-dependent aminotransferase family protein [bacterium]|nr:PLP-dependent aminotransferase family protein [bacterium]
MFHLQIRPDSAQPVYEQLAQQLRQMIRDGLLDPGSKLPGMRELAARLGVSLNTVHAACNLLIADNLLITRRGSGTFVCERPDVVLGMNLRTAGELLAGCTAPRMDWSPLDFPADDFIHPPPPRLKGLVNFAKASPDPTLYPFDRVKKVVSNMLWNPQELLFEYGHVQGHQPLVEHLERQMALRGVPMAVGENEVIITGGFQRGLSILLHHLVRDGRRILVEDPGYSAVVNLLHSERIAHCGVPLDDQGLDSAALRRELERGDVAAVICTPDFHNPTGICMSKARRRELLALAQEFAVPLIEDDWGTELRYDGVRHPPIKALDGGGHVIHVGSFSKSFLPGLRIGWITCPADLAVSLLIAKKGTDRVDNFFLQALLHEFIMRGYYERHLRSVLRSYRRRRDLMCSLLDRHLPRGCGFSRPQGGFSVWLRLPPGWSSGRLLPLARNRGVEFLPGSYCSVDRRDLNALRLSFSRTEPAEIERGILSLCSLLQDCSRRPASVLGNRDKGSTQ